MKSTLVPECTLGEPEIFRRECVRGKSVQKRALQPCDTAEITSGLFNSCRWKLGQRIMPQCWGVSGRNTSCHIYWHCIQGAKSEFGWQVGNNLHKKSSIICKPPPPHLYHCSYWGKVLQGLLLKFTNPNLDLTFASSLAFGKLLNLFLSCFSHLKNEDNNTLFFPRVVVKINAF